MGYVLEHGGLTIQELEALCEGVNRRTLQRDLKDMVEKGLFDERGTGPTDPTKQYVPGKIMAGQGAVTSYDTEL